MGWFERIDKSELKLVGFGLLNDRQQIHGLIQGLITKYPNNTSYNDEGQCCDINNFSDEMGVNVPDFMICPITKQIMTEPVQIFDDLKQHNQSPVTHERVEDDEWMMLPNRKVAQKIQTFLNVNPGLQVTTTK